MNKFITSTPTPPPTSFPAHLLKTSIGKKSLMTISGFIVFGFAVGHMLGNLQIFIGQEQLNIYAEKLQSLGAFLWVIRLTLLTAFGLHIWMGSLLKIEALAARPIGYNKSTTQKATLSSRTMIWTGLIILLFVIYHLLHYTARITHPEYAAMVDSAGRFDVYSMVLLGFSSPVISVFYLLATGLLCYHLSHGIASMFQTLGLTSPAWQSRLEWCSRIFAFLLYIGYASVPLAVMFGCTALKGGN